MCENRFRLAPLFQSSPPVPLICVYLRQRPHALALIVAQRDKRQVSRVAGGPDHKGRPSAEIAPIIAQRGERSHIANITILVRGDKWRKYVKPKLEMPGSLKDNARN